jgi:antitoxin (DNA-binding transcriptional repressor) of toxin-antitoxin stability system
MKVVGVKQPKARLSEYVRLVKAGETILVTDRDDVVAELRIGRTFLKASQMPGRSHGQASPSSIGRGA